MLKENSPPKDSESLKDSMSPVLNFNDAELLKMAFPQLDSENEVIMDSNRLPQKNIQRKSKISPAMKNIAVRKSAVPGMAKDCRFFSKKVRINPVEKDVFIYQLNKKEIEDKKQKSRKSI